MTTGVIRLDKTKAGRKLLKLAPLKRAGGKSTHAEPSVNVLADPGLTPGPAPVPVAGTYPLLYAEAGPFNAVAQQSPFCFDAPPAPTWATIQDDQSNTQLNGELVNQLNNQFVNQLSFPQPMVSCDSFFDFVAYGANETVATI